MYQSKHPMATEHETGAGIRNRTGVSLAPEMALDLIREAQKTRPTSEGDARVLAEYRGTYIKAQEPMGSLPEPLDSGLAGSSGPLLLDKLGERMVFERQGVRLYEGMIGKLKFLGRTAGGPTLGDLEHILSEEREHLRFLQRAVVETGGDPTVLTPCANIAAILSQGVVQVITDPRSTLVQCLEALLLAELADNDGWTLLKQVAQATGAADLLEKIEEAEEHEGEHLTMVRGWLSALVAGGGMEKVGKKMAKAAASSSRTNSKTRARAVAADRKPKDRAPAKASPRRASRSR